MLVINLYGGPGTGKSTMAYGVSHQLKQMGINCEYVHEEAKDFTWEKRAMTLQCQPYIFGKQFRNLWRLQDQVDIAITDSPILLSLIYADKEKWPESFFTYVIDQYKTFKNLDFMLERSETRGYNPKGRNQTENEAKEIDCKIKKMLLDNKIFAVKMEVNEKTVENIVENALLYSKHFLKKDLTNKKLGV